MSVNVNRTRRPKLPDPLSAISGRVVPTPNHLRLDYAVRGRCWNRVHDCPGGAMTTQAREPASCNPESIDSGMVSIDTGGAPEAADQPGLDRADVVRGGCGCRGWAPNTMTWRALEGPAAPPQVPGRHRKQASCDRKEAFSDREQASSDRKRASSDREEADFDREEDYARRKQACFERKTACGDQKEAHFDHKQAYSDRKQPSSRSRQADSRSDHASSRSYQACSRPHRAYSRTDHAYPRRGQAYSPSSITHHQPDAQ